MNRGRRLLIWLLLIVALASGLGAIPALGSFGLASQDYGEHHEVTVALCRFIALLCVSIGCAVTGARLMEPSEPGKKLAAGAEMALTAAVAAGAALIFVNEIFYSIFDPKGFPVHPTEVVMFPGAGWHGMSSHLLAALLLCLTCGWLWWTLRKPRSF